MFLFIILVCSLQCASPRVFFGIKTTLFVLIFAQRALRVISRVFIFAHHELCIISRVLIFAQGHFTRNFFSILYLKQMEREAKFKEYGT